MLLQAPFSPYRFLVLLPVHHQRTHNVAPFHINALSGTFAHEELVAVL
jgi:hypothetical protein